MGLARAPIAFGGCDKGNADPRRFVKTHAVGFFDKRVGFDSAKMWAASEAARPSDSPSGSH